MAAAAAPQRSRRLEEIPAEVTSQIVPILLEIERRKYKPGSDEHYRYMYLAQRLVAGTARNTLEKKKLSQMYSVFETQHGKGEALALMIYLFKSCDDPISAEKLEALVTDAADPGGHYHHRGAPLFAGRRVSEDERAKFNFRKLTASIADELEESKREDFITLLQDQMGEDGDAKATNYRNILDLMTKACNSGVLEVQESSCKEKLLEWLGQLGYRRGGDLTIMKKVEQFDSREQFPGIMRHQESTDSAYEEGIDDEQQFGPGPQSLPSASVDSYSRDSSLFSRVHSTEETEPPLTSEMVAPKNL